MIKKILRHNSSIVVNTSEEGTTLEKQIRARLESGEPLDADAPLIYTDKNDGVLAAYNPRTDRFELALDAMSANSKAKVKKLEASKMAENKGQSPEGEGEQSPAASQ